MGVPAFYRWLSEKYPKSIKSVLESRTSSLSDPNPNTSPTTEFDNLYVDMNGIIHPCSHPESGPQPRNEAEMFANIAEYLDRLINTIRPRKLIYLAIDGVAPRAKMNQQRARRFRSAQEARENEEVQRQVREDMVLRREEVPPEKQKGAWDSNVITPGTEFMLNLSNFVQTYVRARISESSHYWKGIKIIFSDASIPGEGEHKIMSHVRLQRSAIGYDANTRHVLHGLDADLIMLGLATHEVNFFILREEVVFGRRGQEALDAGKEASGHKEQQRQMDEEDRRINPKCINTAFKPLQILALSTLREYLKNEFKVCESVPFPPNFERLVDDIVFLCFFVGNDFLPHLPSLDIRDGALDYLFNVYKRLLPTLGDYITNDGGEVNLGHVDVILAEVGKIEDYVFAMRHQAEMAQQRRMEAQKSRMKVSEARLLQNQQNGNGVQPPQQEFARQGKSAGVLAKSAEADKDKNNAAAAEQLKAQLVSKTKKEKKSKKKAAVVKEEEEDDAILEPEIPLTESEEAAKKRMKMEIEKKQRAKLDDHGANVVDNVRLHEVGWKDRYYTDKCKAEDIEGRGGKEHLWRSYITGLCWVMKYYYSGVASWKWFYPFHYAPFASDLRNIERFEKDIDFELAMPFSPVEQMMGVFPGDTAHAVPKECRYLLTDDDSPIIDFYPKDVPCDPNGKAMPWLWVVLLPFIDESRLLAAMKPTHAKWTAKEKMQNMRGLLDGWLFVHSEHELGDMVESVALCSNKGDKGVQERSLGDAARWQGFTGTVIPPLKSHQIGPREDIPRPKGAGVSSLLEDVKKNFALCCAFSQPEKRPHLSVILKSAVESESVLEAHDLTIRRPRLNRGGGNICDMGGNGNQGGHVKGTTFEPQKSQKRQRVGPEGQWRNAPVPQMMPQQMQGMQQMQHNMWGGGGQGGGQQWQPGGQGGYQQPQQGYQQGFQGQQQGQQQWQQQPQQGWQQQNQGGYARPPQQFVPPPPPPPQFPPQFNRPPIVQARVPPPPQQQFSFNRGGGNGGAGGGRAGGGAPQQFSFNRSGGAAKPQPPKNASSSVMASLKDQLRATMAKK